jgi:hypothetical protein
MKKIILALIPLEKKDRGLTQFCIECENTLSGIKILHKEHPNRFKVMGVSNYLGKDEDFQNKLLY